jgi:hypothetical protein
MRIPLRRIALLAVAALLFHAPRATAQVRRYLYELDTRSGDPLFSGEIPTGAPLKAAYAEVATDNLGRVTRVTWLWDGKKTSEVLYHFAPGARLPDAYDVLAATGETTSKHRIQRNPSGVRTRVETFSLTGTLTGYEVRTVGSDQVDETAYAPDGKRTNHSIDYYSPQGVSIRHRWYPEDSTYYESESDATTGLSASRKKVVSGQVVSSDKFTYDAYGDETRDDIYDAQGNWYGAREYAENLLTIERYKFPSGETQETHPSYDENRRTTEATFSRNGALVCTFKYDRLATGQVKRTLAVAPGGELLAEYADLYVNKVLKNGRPIDHPDAGTIYRKGDWW